MAFDAYLKIKDIPGECTDAKHEKWIQILSYSHGVSNMVSSMASAGGGGSQGAELSDLSIVKNLDKASIKMTLACCNGTDIGDTTIELCKGSGDKEVYMTYKMEKPVKLTSVRPGGSSQGGSDVPLEEATFNYGKLTWTYNELDEKGASKGKVEGNWDTKTNKGG